MTKHLVVVDKSTVPVGTADLVTQTIQKALDLSKSDLTFAVVSNPEFLIIYQFYSLQRKCFYLY